MKIAVVGATGMVGRVMLDVLAERKFPISELIPVASQRSVGNKVSFAGNEYTIVSMEDAIASKPEIAIFSAGGSTSLEYAPKFAAVGSTVIDNSSAWRMDPDKKLIVPEINAHELGENDKIIANPNCSTIQLVVALNNLHKTYQINRMVISTYQSVTGTGKAAVNQLSFERSNIPGDKVYPYQIDLNCIPHCDIFLDNGYTKEEMKLVHESRKIFGSPELAITATAVRIPVIGGHSESVNVSFHSEFEMEDVKNILTNTDGVIVMDSPEREIYPMPFHSQGKDAVFVGRLRRDESAPNTINMWVVSDNLRKGAATNAVQIAEYLVKNDLINTEVVSQTV